MKTILLLSLLVSLGAGPHGCRVPGANAAELSAAQAREYHHKKSVDKVFDEIKKEAALGRTYSLENGVCKDLVGARRLKALGYRLTDRTVPHLCKTDQCDDYHYIDKCEISWKAEVRK
jgi:hypothetical protein